VSVGGVDARDRRVIPACAGKGKLRPQMIADPTGHPRLRGEGAGSWARTCPTFGSSPPARGRACPGPVEAELQRVIPACAGKGAPAPTRWSSPAGHPRLRGEGSTGPRRSHTGNGSSPPARGRAER